MPATPPTTSSDPAAPITTYLLGYAAAAHDADPDRLEELAAAATALAEKWDGKDPDADGVRGRRASTSDDDELVDAD